MSRTILVTGGAGFIGSNFIRFVLRERSDAYLINLDCLSYAGSLANLRDVERNPRYRFVHGNICDPEAVYPLVRECDEVVHFAAESHVDRSIADSQSFVQTNVAGTHILLEAARRVGVRRIVHVSTDEVYGSLPLERADLRFVEGSALRPSSPYAASKASSDLLVLAYRETYQLDCIVTRCSNNFGPYQYPEKVIPLFVTNLIRGKKVPLYGDGRNIRDWIHVEDHCEALLALLEGGRGGEVYNIGADNERSNYELTRTIIEMMGREENAIEYVEDRLGHDRRYAMDSTKLRTELGWQPTRSAWPHALADTIQWYVNNREWWEKRVDARR